MKEIYYGLDTNIILLNANNIFNYSNVVLTSTVIKELDSKKTLMDDTGYNAREFGRIMTTADVIETVTHDNLYTVVKLKLNDMFIYYVHCPTDSSLSNDEKIIKVLKSSEQFLNCEIKFISNDVNARMVALCNAVATAPLVDVKDQNELTYHKEIELDHDVFHTIDGSNVDTLEFHTAGTFSYTFTTKDSGQVKAASVINNKIVVIDKAIEKELRQNSKAAPINKEQLLASQAIHSSDVDIVVIEAKAGAGKTIVAVQAAMRLVELGKYQGILYVRNSINDVPRNEEVGYLSTNEAKFDVYLHPMYDTLDFIIREQLKKKKLKGTHLEEAVTAMYDEYINTYNIECTTMLGMRGRTFHNTLIIVDEAQNTSPSTMQKMITRVGKGSKIVVLGSNRQIDNAYVTKHDNGMAILMQNAHIPFNGVNTYVIQLQKVVRSAIAEYGEMLFSKELKGD